MLNINYPIDRESLMILEDSKDGLLLLESLDVDKTKLNSNYILPIEFELVGSIAVWHFIRLIENPHLSFIANLDIRIHI